MAPKLHACLTKFLFDARVDGNRDASEGSILDSLLLSMERKAASVADVIGIQQEVASDNVASCDAPTATPTLSSASDYILLNAMSTPRPGAAP
jgi:hypothetical protein